MYRIGIDLGGTNIAAGVVDETHHLLGQASLPTLAGRPVEEVVADLGRAAELALAEAGVALTDCSGIGIGSPGACDARRGVVRFVYNLGWIDEVPLCELLSRRFSLPVFLDNDANCAALAETVAGAAVGHESAVLITLGTGVGGGIIIGGRVYNGYRGAAGELGHIPLVLGGEVCCCGQKGCWEAYASVTALIRQTARARRAHPESLLAETPEEAITGRTAFRAAKAGDETAQAVVRQYADYVAAGCVTVVNALAPEVILIGGGISREGDYLLDPIRRYVRRNCFGGECGAVPEIRAAALGGEAGIIGAAALCRE